MSRSKLHNYDEVVERVAQQVGLDDPSKIRLTPHNCYSQQPKPTPIKYRGVQNLVDMLIHYNQVGFVGSSWQYIYYLPLIALSPKLLSVMSWQTSDILYYEVLDIPLSELQGLKNLKVAYHPATKDEVGPNFLAV